MMRRAIVTTLVLSFVGLGCGAGDDAGSASDPDRDSAATTRDTSSEETDAGATDIGTEPDAGANGGDGDFDDHGGVTFTMSGGYEVSGSWAFVPEASLFAGWWSMSFTDLSIGGGAILTLSLDPANLNVGFGDGKVSFVGLAPECTIDIEHQDASGASGSFDCEHLTGFTETGVADDISVSGSFDARV